MKRAMAALAAMAAVLCLAGCELAQETAATPGITPSPTATPIPSPTPTIGIAAATATPSPTPLPSPSPTLAPTATPKRLAAAELAGLDNDKQGWGPGREVDERNRPVSALSYQEKYGEYGALFILPEAEEIYLTFDEGYENGYTASILDTLKDKGVKSVFFVTAFYVKQNPDLVRRMIDEGHVVGNHSWSHPSLPDKSLEEGREEIEKLHRYVAEQFGYEMELFRPPMGEFSERTLALAASLGYRSAFWSFAYADWDPDRQMDEAQALKKVLDAAHPGALYLLHAVSETNDAILGEAIDGLREAGYELAQLR